MKLGGITTEPTAELAVDVRRRVNSLLDDLAEQASGLLLTVDEAHTAARPELREIATITQHLIREDREFALVMAGLPSAVSSLLRRCSDVPAKS
jgi:type II secretory pathway predicted ATPase ExeA